jgi:hypothetical protein
MNEVFINMILLIIVLSMFIVFMAFDVDHNVHIPCNYLCMTVHHNNGMQEETVCGHVGSTGMCD